MTVLLCLMPAGSSPECSQRSIHENGQLATASAALITSTTRWERALGVDAAAAVVGTVCSDTAGGGAPLGVLLRPEGPEGGCGAVRGGLPFPLPTAAVALAVVPALPIGAGAVLADAVVGTGAGIAPAIGGGDCRTTAPSAAADLPPPRRPIRFHQRRFTGPLELVSWADDVLWGLVMDGRLTPSDLLPSPGNASWGGTAAVGAVLQLHGEPPTTMSHRPRLVSSTAYTARHHRLQTSEQGGTDVCGGVTNRNCKHTPCTGSTLTTSFHSSAPSTGGAGQV